MVCVHTITNLPLSPCALYKANMLLLYYMILFVSGPFIIFSMSHDCVTYDCDMLHNSITSCDLCDHHA